MSAYSTNRYGGNEHLRVRTPHLSCAQLLQINQTEGCMLRPPDAKAGLDVALHSTDRGSLPWIPLAGSQPLPRVPPQPLVMLWPHTLLLPAFIHTCVLCFIHVDTKIDVMFDPGGLYLFTPRVALTSHVPFAEEQRGPLALFPPPLFIPADGQASNFLFNHQLTLLHSTAVSRSWKCRKPQSSLLYPAAVRTLSSLNISGCTACLLAAQYPI